MTIVKAITPIIATILLVVVAVILVTIILSFGKGFTTSSLDKTKTLEELSVSDAGAFVYPKSYSSGIIQINYQPPMTIQEPVVITRYKVLEIQEMETITLSTPITLTNNSQTNLPLDCLYEYSLESPDMTIQLITEDNTYINVKQRDPGMVCTSGGTGTLADPIIVCNAEDLNNVSNDLDANYMLGKDIDLQCFSRRTNEGWNSIGGDGGNDPFTGNFNGLNHAIKNLYIYRINDNGLGLFTVLSGDSNILDLRLEDINISLRQGGGALAATVENMNINNCYATGTIYSQGNQVGGLIGTNVGNISNCYSNVSVICTEPGTGYCGGLVGDNYGNISNSYSEGAVLGSGPYVGGLIGASNSGIISNCYSLGDITRLSGTETSFGGFLGAKISGTITNCYSIGRVIYEGTTNPTNRGFSSSSITGNNYWDTQTSLQSTSGGGAVAKTTTQMKTQSTFTNWDFSTVWTISSNVNDGYPYLINNLSR